MNLYHQSQRERGCRTAEDYFSAGDSRVESNSQPSTLNPQLTMGCIKHYIGNLVCQCSDERFGQEAVETAIFNGRVPLTYNLEQDLATIMGPSPLVAPELPAKAERLYDQLVEEYQAECRRNFEALTPSYAPILEQLAA